MRDKHRDRWCRHPGRLRDRMARRDAWLIERSATAAIAPDTALIESLARPL